jgi:hypothetical protein
MPITELWEARSWGTRCPPIDPTIGGHRIAAAMLITRLSRSAATALDGGDSMTLSGFAWELSSDFDRETICRVRRPFLAIAAIVAPILQTQLGNVARRKGKQMKTATSISDMIASGGHAYGADPELKGERELSVEELAMVHGGTGLGTISSLITIGQALYQGAKYLHDNPHPNPPSTIPSGGPNSSEPNGA